MTPELAVSPMLASELAYAASSLGSCEAVEAHALNGTLRDALGRLAGWSAFVTGVTTRLRTHHHVVVRGTPNDPAAFVIAAAAAGNEFRRYRSNKVVKRFSLSPWTRALSHTIAEGHFHTDLNTAPLPPRVTAIQCVVPDPDAPHHGEVRVARLEALLSELARSDQRGTLQFLCEQDAVMVSDSEPHAWRGRIVNGGEIRFHPETLRAAYKRLGLDECALEQHLAQIKAAALAASVPTQLGAGDILFVSNRRALHYRGACTVRFRRYPGEFDSRTVHVLHLMDESA